MHPKVTVLIPVFNRERFVDEAIRSVIQQEFVDFELLLIDDGSTDGTPEVLDMWRQRDARRGETSGPAVVPRRADAGAARSSDRVDEVSGAWSALADHSTSNRHCRTDHGLAAGRVSLMVAMTSGHFTSS
jgi:glycosyltransferase involved in cell wall biosynthesis